MPGRPSSRSITMIRCAATSSSANTRWWPAIAAEHGYSLSDPEDRARMQKDLLSHLRPEARDVAGDARAGLSPAVRPAPPRDLGHPHRALPAPPDAASTRMPPASRSRPTEPGEAFDISYKFMASDEQNFVDGPDRPARGGAEGGGAPREPRGHPHLCLRRGRPAPRADGPVRARDGGQRARRAGRRKAGPTGRKVKASKKAKAKPAVKRTRAAHGRPGPAPPLT